MEEKVSIYENSRFVNGDAEVLYLKFIKIINIHFRGMLCSEFLICNVLHRKFIKHARLIVVLDCSMNTVHIKFTKQYSCGYYV